MIIRIDPLLVKPFRLTYLAKGREGEASSSLNLNLVFLTFCLLLTYRPILALLEYKLKVANIFEMHKTVGLEVVVVWTFDRFPRYVQIVGKSDEKVL